MARQERLAAWPVTAELAVTNSGERNNAEGPPHTGAANTLGLPCGQRLAYRYCWYPGLFGTLCILIYIIEGVQVS